VRETEVVRRRMTPITAKLQEKYSKIEIAKMTLTEQIQVYKQMVFEDEGVAEGNAKGSSSSLSKNKQKRAAEELKNMSEKKQMKLLEKSVGQIPSMMREFEAEEKAKAERKKYEQGLKDETAEMEKKGRVTFYFGIVSD
jgi:hypothetical protein